MKKIVEHVCGSIRAQNTETLLPVYDSQFPIRSTGDMRTWYTGKPTEYSKKSHINRCVFDSTWEACEAFHFDHNKNVEAWVKNDHIGFEVFYSFEGVIRKYRPDFIIRLKTGEHLIIETKGRDTQKDKVKREYLREWVTAVNNDGRFGRWLFDVSYSPADLPDKIQVAVKSKKRK